MRKIVQTLHWLVLGPAERVNGMNVDWVWEDPETATEPGAVTIRRGMHVVRPKFELFGLANIAFNVIGTRLLPLAGAIAIYNGWLGTLGAGNVLLAVAACGLLETVFEFGFQVLRYSFAVQNFWMARMRYIAGDKEAAQHHAKVAIDATTPKPAAFMLQTSIKALLRKEESL